METEVLVLIDANTRKSKVSIAQCSMLPRNQSYLLQLQYVSEINFSYRQNQAVHGFHTAHMVTETWMSRLLQSPLLLQVAASHMISGSYTATTWCSCTLNTLPCFLSSCTSCQGTEEQLQSWTLHESRKEYRMNDKHWKYAVIKWTIGNVRFTVAVSKKQGGNVKTIM